MKIKGVFLNLIVLALFLLPFSSAFACNGCNIVLPEVVILSTALIKATASGLNTADFTTLAFI